MLGFTPLAVTPLAVANANTSYLSEIADGATVGDTAPAALVIFPTAISELAGVSDSDFVAASTFNVSMSEASAGSEETSAVLVLDCVVAELGAASESTSVTASTFNAPVVEAVSAVDAFLAAAVFTATVQGSAVAADQIVARFLWVLVDDSQNPGWTVIGTDN